MSLIEVHAIRTIGKVMQQSDKKKSAQFIWWTKPHKKVFIFCINVSATHICTFGKGQFMVACLSRKKWTKIIQNHEIAISNKQSH